MGKVEDLRNRCYELYEKLWVFTNREPFLTIRRAIWILTAGWALALGYLLAAVGMVTSIVFIPFAPAAARFALFALDTVTQENYLHVPKEEEHLPWYHNPVHPFCICANILWLIFFGWTLALAHLAAAIVQALTIIGIPTAFTSIQMGLFALWPFGQGIRKRFLPTSLEQLREHEAAQEGAQGRSPLLPSQEHTSGGDEAV